MNLKLTCFLILNLFAITRCMSQLLEPQFANNIPIGSKSVKDGDDNMYCAGKIFRDVDIDPSDRVVLLSPVGVSNLYISKFDKNGQLLWVKTIASGQEDQFVDLAVDHAGNVIMAAITNTATIDVDPGPNQVLATNTRGYDLIGIKLDPNGQFIWGKTLLEDSDKVVEDAQGNTSFIHSLVIDKNNDIVIAGEFVQPIRFDPTASFTSKGSSDVYFAKFSAGGTFLFAKQIGGADTQSMSTLAIDSENGIVLTGGYFGNTDLDPTQNDFILSGSPRPGNSTGRRFNEIFLARYTAAGDLQWARKLKTENYGLTDLGINTDKPGFLSVTGGFSGTLDLGAYGTVDANSRTGIIVTYTLNGDVTRVFRIDGDFDGLHFSPPDFPVVDFKVDRDGNMILLVVANGHITFTPKISYNIFPSAFMLVKYAPDGSFLWAYPVTGEVSSIHYAAIGLTNQNDIVISGYLWPVPADIDPRACVLRLINYKYTSNFYAVYRDVPIPIITSFSLAEQLKPAVIDQVKKIIYITIRADANIKQLSPAITTNRGQLDLVSGISRDFSGTVTYNILEDCIKYPYEVEVYQAYAGKDQQLCAREFTSLQANTPKAGGQASWTIVQPAGFNPFSPANAFNPGAVVKIPQDTKVILRWTIDYPIINESLSDEVTVYNYSMPIVSAGTNKVISPGEKTRLEPVVGGSGPYTYSWSPVTGLSDPLTKNPLAGPAETTTYYLTAANVNGCKVVDSMRVILSTTLKIPNAFTPNNDGINDTWTIKNLEGFPGNSIDLYNRNGERIYSSRGNSPDWDGRINGKRVPMGNYYYIIRTGGKSPATFKGFITILY